MTTIEFARIFRATVLLAFLTAATTVAALGQLSTATINGTVRDSTGAVVPQAQIVLQNIATGVERSTASNEVGYYLFLSISPGNYILKASADGFRTTSVEPFGLQVNQTATFDVTLEVGSIAESVTVEATGSELQASTAELGSVMGEQQVVDLPLNGRNFTQMLALTPGASPVSVGQNRGGGQAVAVGSFTYPSINGQSNRSNNFMTDGATNNGVFMSTYVVPPMVDSIQEFKVQSHNDEAEFGGSTGGVVNVVTKSGTNNFHGSGYWFMRDDALDARNYFRQEVTPLDQHMYGGTLGGPIVRNKLFFFTGYQGFYNRTPADRLYRVPTDANLRGDLSDWDKAIFDPFSTTADPDGNGFIRTPFPNNIIPASRLDPGWLYYAEQSIPNPIETGVANRNQLDLSPRAQDQHEYTARLDYHLSEKDIVWARGSGSIFNQDSSGGRQTLVSYNDTNSINIAASWTHTFSPTSIMQIQGAISENERDQGNAFLDVPDDFLDRVGFDNQFVDFRSGLSFAPNVNVQEFFSGGESTLYAQPSKVKQIKGNFTKILGNHQIKFGGSWDDIDYRRIINDHNVNFNSADTADPQNPGKTGSPLASWLLDVVNASGRRDFNKTTRDGGVFGFFAQDSWKVTQRLRINFGLRYDYTIVPPIGLEEDGTIYMGNYDMYRGVYLLQAKPDSCEVLGAAPCIPTPDGSLMENVMVDPRGKLLANFTDNWQPRFGMAYRLSNTTALRGSFGMFFDSWAGIMQTSQNLGHTWPDIGRRLGSNLNKTTAAAPVPEISGKNPFPNAAQPSPTPFNDGAHFQDPNTKNSYSIQWNVGLQHQLRDDILLSANYVGSGNRRLPIGGYYNVAQIPGPGNAAERRPYPYIKPTNWHRWGANGNYHGLQLQFQKRFSRGLALTANYTWSKAIDEGCSGYFGVEGCSVQDPYQVSSDRSVTGADLPHIFNVNWVWEIPVGRGRANRTGNSVLDVIIGDWQFNGIARFRSGQPYSVNVNGDIANTGNRNGYMRPDLAGDPVIDNPEPERWFNTDAFAVPQKYTFGTAGRHILRQQGRANFDLSLFRHIPITERYRIEFRAEAFNAFNRTNFGRPNSNLSSSNFGRVLSAGGERQIQLGVKFLF